MDLFAFFNHADLTNDKVPPTVAEKSKGSRKKRKGAEGASGSNLPPKKLRADHGTSDAGASTGGKSVAALQGLLERRGGRTDSVTGTSLRTQHPVERSLIPDPPVMTTAIATTVVAIASSVSMPRAGDEPVHASIYGFHLRWMKTEHILREKKKLEGRCSRQANVLKERDAEIASLRAQLTLKEDKPRSLKERTAALEGQVAVFESALSCDELSVKAASLEFEKDKLTYQVSMLETTCSRLRDQRWILGRGLRLIVMKCLQSPEYLAALGRAIGRAIDKGRQDGLAACIDHGKGGRGLVDVAAYNPFAEANYFSTVNALRAVDFPLLAQLESQKDASMADFMGLLHLEGDVVSHRLSLSDTMIPLIEPLSPENLAGEASTFEVSATATTTALSTTFTQTISIPSILVADYEVSGAELPAKVPSPPKIVFEKEELETTLECTTAN
nr:hypothetical protein [Tanacetum cinerariifolium]